MNKYLITIIVPVFGYSFDIEIPNNRKIGTIKKILLDYINENFGFFANSFDSVRLIDRDSGNEYTNNFYVKDSQIRNGTKLVIM